jgi:thioesterase domain-containing protein
VPIGQPLANTTCLIVNESLEPVPIGVPGELLIGGTGLALGYLHQPELTAEKFIPDPFSGVSGARLYRTGDRCRWLPDGTIEFLGRQDGQVKIRGHRVETGEIEAALAALAGVEQAVVVVRRLEQPGGSMQKLLRACVVPLPGRSLDVSQLRRDLARLVPEPMMPGEWLVLESLPLTENGKVDRRGLASVPRTVCPDEDGPKGPQDDAAPGTLLEWEIMKIWNRLFGRDHIDRSADFFELGGHSLLAAQLAVELDRLLGRRVPITTLFGSPTIASLARTLADESWLPAWTSLVPLKPTGSRAPLYLFHGLGGDVMHFVGFSRLLAADQPVYGVRAVDCDGRSLPHRTVEEMAKHYTIEIRAFQPEGPYRLGGYSLGGCMAYAVAMELRGQGQEVNLLIFDTNPLCRLPWPASGVRTLLKPLIIMEEVRLHFRHMADLGVRKWPRYVAVRLEALVRPAFSPAQQGARATVEADGIPIVGADRYFKAIRRFSAHSIAARVELFLARETVMERLMSLGLATVWRRLVRGPVNVHRLRCEHVKIFSPEQLPGLAAMVDAVLADERLTEPPVGGGS